MNLPADSIKNILAVAAGGAIGSVIRYAFVLAMPPALTKAIWTLTLINLLGSFAIGLAAGYFVHKPNAVAELFLITGLLGGFTTFSAFSHQNLQLIKDQQLVLALTNIGIQVFAGLLLAALGLSLSQKVFA